MVRQILQIGVGVLFPGDCPICGKHQTFYSLPICEKCKKSILSGKTLPAVSSSHLPEIWSCLPYEGAIRECIKQFKYSGQKQIVGFFKELTQHFFDEKNISNKNFDLVIPIPIHLIRRLSRGYNQSELIAKILSDLSSVPFSRSELIKTKNTKPQIKLSKKDRVKNLKGSFLVPCPHRVTGKSILLVDDVMTTGTTLETCAKELLKAGARKVYGFTLARTI